MAGFHLDDMMIEHKPVFIPYIMIIESDAELSTMLQQTLKQELKIGTIFARTMGDALNITQALCPALFLINQHLIGGDGLMLSDILRQNILLASVPILLLTTDLPTTQKPAQERGITCLPIPDELDDLLSVIKNHLSVSALPEERQKTKTEFAQG